jgi:opacity protein-like surface antigen
MRRLLLSAVLMLAGASSARAQAWDAPSFFSPRPGEDIGIYAFKLDSEVGGGTGFSGIWRQSGNLNLGVRVGVVEGDRWLVGGEYYGNLSALTGPLLASWVVGFGGTFFDDVTVLRIPVGVSVGMNLGSGTGMSIMPYAHPRVAYDLTASDNAAGEEETVSDFSFAVDLGADIALGSSLVGRVGFTLGESNTFGAGIAYRMPRRVEVR